MKKCSRCNNEFHDESVKFCNNCGEKLFDASNNINQQKCTKCGFESAFGSIFCSSCGNKLYNNQTNYEQVNSQQQNFQQNYQDNYQGVNNQYQYYQKPIYTFPAFLSLIVPGLGQLVKGEISNGILFFLSISIGVFYLFTNFSFINAIYMIMVHIAQVYHAARENPNDKNDNIPGIIFGLVVCSKTLINLFINKFNVVNFIFQMSVLSYLIYLYVKEKEQPGYFNTTIIGKIKG